MIVIPDKYAEWMDLFDLLEAGTDDEEVLCAMQKGTIVWQSSVAERFSKALVNTVNSRMNKASDLFQKSIGRSHGSDRDVIGALLALRKELQFLMRVVDLPALPESQREQYKEMVKEQSEKVQESLEESAKRDRTGKLLSMIKNHRVAL